MSKSKPAVSLWKAGVYYMKGYLKQSRFAWTTFLFWSAGRILTVLVPSLLVSSILNNIQSGEFEKSDQFLILLLAVFLMALGELCVKISLHFASGFQVRQADQIMKDAYDNLIGKSLSFHADNFAGSLTTKINRLARGSTEFNDTLHFNVFDMIAFIGFTAIVLGRDAPFTVLLSILSLFVYVLIVSPVIKKRMEMVKERSILESERTGLFVDGITNVLTIKSFAREKSELKGFSDHVDKTGDLKLKTWRYNIWRVDPITMAFYTMLVFVPLAILIQQSGENVEVGSLFLTYTLFSAVAAKIWDISRIWRNIERQLAEAAEGLEVLWQPSIVTDAENAKQLKVKKAAIEFDNVDFSYDNQKLFSEFSLSIPLHQKVGLVGPSGGGKSTFMKLILRFMDVNSGSVMIDEQDISKATQKSLRENLSYIPQEPLLFHRSIYENIAYGNKKATKSSVIAAAKKAHAHEFIEKLPNGYDTLVGERGVKLSGGQRQRVAIARAFLKNAPILILDEATSALDSESEVLIQESLVDLMKNRTVIVIAHRLSTIKHLDRIVVLNEGQIIQDGNHEELTKEKGLYKELWSHQSGGFL